MKKKLLLILGVVPIFAVAACGGNEANVTADNGDMVTNISATDTPASSDAAVNGTDGNATVAAPMSGQAFANAMAASDAYEIAAGKLAQQKATSAPLKAFGAMMVGDHTTATTRLKAAAADASPAITPVPAMTDEQQANLETLEAATGSVFDTAYKTQQLVAHEKALATLRAYAGTGDVAALRSFANAAQDVVAGHYDRIRGM